MSRAPFNMLAWAMPWRLVCCWLCLTGCATTPVPPGPAPAPSPRAPSPAASSAAPAKPEPEPAQPAPASAAAAQAEVAASVGLEQLAGLPKIQQRADEYLKSLPDHELVEVHAVRELPAAVLKTRTLLEGRFAVSYFVLIGPEPSRVHAIELTDCGQFVGLRDIDGRGRRLLLFTEMQGGAHCINGLDEGYELIDAEWREFENPPQHLSGAEDVNGDNIPDFPFELAAMHMGDCVWVNCAAYAWTIQVPLYEAYDAKGQLVRSAQPYQTIYRQRFDEASKLAAGLPPPSQQAHEDAFCANQALQLAGEVYVYGMLTGQPQAQLVAVVDRMMHGRLDQPCKGMGLKPSLSWPQARRQLLGLGAQLEAIRRAPLTGAKPAP